jgi:DNA-binding response OmpR family regulator
MPKALKNIKILLVEDDQDIRNIYSRAFIRRGFTVYTANDGRSGLKKFKNKKPDIILLDIMMPHTDGYQVLKEIRKDVTRYQPIIMLTNLDPSHFEHHAQFDDVDEYLVKSRFSPSEVVEKTICMLKLNKIIA